MNQKSAPKNVDGVFAQNLTELIGRNHTISSLSRDLDVHRNQLQRFVDGVSYPKPDILQRLCKFFGVDARILTHPLAELRQNNGGMLPAFLMDAVDPVPQDMFPDGFYEEWRELHESATPFICQLVHVKTIDGVRHSKVKVNNLVVSPDGEIRELDKVLTFRGVALRQAGGLCILDRPRHNTGLTFTALRFGIYGDADLFAGHKRSVRSVTGSGLLRKSATVLRRLNGGYREAMFVRRQPRFRSAEETPELIQWLLKEQAATLPFG